VIKDSEHQLIQIVEDGDQPAEIMAAQKRKAYDNLSRESKMLGMVRKYDIYLPPDHEISQRSYPILYLHHGGGDNFLKEGNSLGHIALRKKEISLEFRIKDGEHTWTY
jgi:predicted alpha/beta superfamily hydrolase